METIFYMINDSFCNQDSFELTLQELQNDRKNHVVKIEYGSLSTTKIISVNPDYLKK